MTLSTALELRKPAAGARYVDDMPRRARSRQEDPSPAAGWEVNVNQIVAYNLRAARERKGWTQETLAKTLERLSGIPYSHAMISALERAWDGERRREFDAQELALLSAALEIPIVWFFLPPPNEHRPLEQLGRPAFELYWLLLGKEEQLEPIHERLRELGIHDPTPAEETARKVTGQRSFNHQWNYRQRRKDLLLALLDNHADGLDKAADELGEFFDHLRQVGIRGFVAENTMDADFATLPENRSPAPGDPEATTDSPVDEPQDDSPAGSTGPSPNRASSMQGSR